MNKAKSYRDKINALEKQLTKENAQYFSELRNYMSFSGILLDEGELNEQIYQMEADLFAAQADGITPVEFFGNDAKTMADELLRNTKKASPRSLVKLVLIVTGVLWAINLVSDFSNAASFTIAPLSYLLAPIIGSICISLIFLAFKNNVYSKAGEKKRNTVLSIQLFLIVLFFIGCSLVGRLALREVWEITIPFPIDCIVMAVIALGLSFWLIKARPQEFYPMAFMIYVFIGIGIYLRIIRHNGVEGLFWQVSLPLVVLFISLILTGFWTNKLTKKLETE